MLISVYDGMSIHYNDDFCVFFVLPNIKNRNYHSISCHRKKKQTNKQNKTKSKMNNMSHSTNNEQK